MTRRRGSVGELDSEDDWHNYWSRPSSVIILILLVAFIVWLGFEIVTHYQWSGIQTY